MPARVLHLGEVHTGLLQHPRPLPADQVADLLDLVGAEQVRAVTRPVPRAVSPDLLTGVDCLLPSAAGRRMRAVGTVSGHVSVTGGHVLQAATHTQVSGTPVSGTPVSGQQRLPWSHYLARPGCLEAIGRVHLDDVATGFSTGPRPATLDVGAVATRLMDRIQQSPLLHREPPFRSRRVALRWVVTSGSQSAVFSIASAELRTLTIRLDEPDIEAIRSFCEDLALHDWLLSTLTQIVAAVMDAPGDRAQRVRRLGPAIDVLPHLWMPGFRLTPETQPLWEALDARTGLSRQWQTCVDRVRDQVTLSMLT